MIDYKTIYDKLIERSDIYLKLKCTMLTIDTTSDEFKERKELINRARQLENEIYTYENIIQALHDFKESDILYSHLDGNNELILTLHDFDKSMSVNYANFCFCVRTSIKEENENYDFSPEESQRIKAIARGHDLVYRQGLIGRNIAKLLKLKLSKSELLESKQEIDKIYDKAEKEL